MMPTKPFFKCYFHAGDQRIRYNRDRAEALHTWAENEGIKHRVDPDSQFSDNVVFTFYFTSDSEHYATDQWLAQYECEHQKG